MFTVDPAIHVMIHEGGWRTCMRVTAGQVSRLVNLSKDTALGAGTTGP